MTIGTTEVSALRWNGLGRAVVFVLAATSIACLLAEFYGVCPMRPLAIYLLGPAIGLLFVLAWLDGHDRRLRRAVLIGAAGGLIAAVAYDVFRLPFVYAKPWGLDGTLPAMNLFKVFPRFGAMILDQPLEQPSYTLSAHLVGWAYHFSNGLTFGVMYLALIGDPARRHWGWAVAFAAGLEVAMLLTPYPTFFGIHVTGVFVVVTLTAHVVFGTVLGKAVRGMAWFGRGVTHEG